MMTDYFSDRERGSRPRTAEVIDAVTWEALFAVIHARIDNGSFGYGFPATCPDGNALCGTNEVAFWRVARAEIPQLVEGDFGPWWPPRADKSPPTLAILDFLEFTARAVGAPTRGNWHDYQRHYHLTLDREAGLRLFVDDVNRVLARSGVAFELTPQGRVRRLLPEPIAQVLREVLFRTGDGEADALLEKARIFIASPNIDVRRDALEKLWDAFERIKTLEPGANKGAQAAALLTRATAHVGPRFGQLIGDAAKRLTEAGNEFRIRHAETDKEIVSQSAQIDYLFVRMFAFLRYVLSSTDRGG